LEERAEVGGGKFPYLAVFIDELRDVTADKEALALLIDLASLRKIL
jgi:hypothetical protein